MTRPFARSIEESTKKSTGRAGGTRSRLGLFVILSLAGANGAGAQTLEERLGTEDPAALARAALGQGDAVRGAIVFHQPYLACTKCHRHGAERAMLGPDLTKADEQVTGAYLVEALLNPSKTIKKGFEAITVQMVDGSTVTGLLVKEGVEGLTLRDASRDGAPITLPKSEIEERGVSRASIMPAGQMNQLTSRQQFLDLVRYLIEIAEGGPTRAKELQPAPALYAARPLPEYEKNLDHAGMIADSGDESFNRGEAIYKRLCVNCHGTRDRPGSLPTSLRFAAGKFKNGADPYAMYRTLTRGFGMMVPQSWMVPRQKYDVIHYIREAYLKEHNPTQYVRVDLDYLAQTPKGSTRGPEPTSVEPWVTMDYGPSLINTYEVGADGSNFAYKGIAVRLDAGPGGVSRGRHWMIFDHDTLRVAAAWSGEGFVDWNGIHFNGRHNSHPRIVGQATFANPTGPGWAEPRTKRFDDPRLRGRDDRPYGPLPREWAHYEGLYRHGDRTIISYTVGETPVLEMPGLARSEPSPVFTRTFRIGPRETDLILQVAHRTPKDAPLHVARTAGKTPALVAVFGPEPSHDQKPKAPPARADEASQAPQGRLVVRLADPPPNAEWLTSGDGALRLRIPAGAEPLKLLLSMTLVDKPGDAEALASSLKVEAPPIDLETLVHGGPAQWPTTIATEAVIGSDDGPFAVDVLTRPTDNPWLCQVRPTGLDFFANADRGAVCTWDGDVWLVTGLESPENGLTWRRIAAGLFQPLGLKIVDETVHVTCRDQLVVLHDLNGDEEIDFYENLNNDHQVTEHFHEFAMGLQTDADGNFYYAKSARHALPALVPHHGTLLRISRDGSRTDILANGFRAANGVCLNPDGTFIVTDQEGHWNPKNRINWVKEGGFYGNMFGYHDVTDSSDDAMEQPLCWITNAFDRSPAELLWVDSDAWGPIKGSLLNLSYGYGKAFVVPHEEIDGQMQGGMCELPIPQFPTGLMRGRFHPDNGQLHACGMFSWASTQQQPGGLYRIRYTGKPAYVPIGLEAKRSGMRITFSDPLDRQRATDPANYAVKTWSLKRTAEYGSEHYDETSLSTTGASLSADGKRVFLAIPDIEPTWCMEIKYSVSGADGAAVEGRIHNTIHALR